MSPVSEARRRLLQQAVHGFLQRHPEATRAAAELDIAAALCVSQASVQKWRAGYPIADAHVPRLAEWAVRRAGMGREWLRAFLRACDHPDPALEAALFGAPVPSDLAQRCRDLHRRFWGADRLGADPSYFPRPALSALLEDFLRSDRPGLILVAPSGMGKTGFALHLARSGTVSGYTVLTLPAADLDGERPLPALLSSLLALPALDACPLSWPLLVALDGVNESPDMVRLTWQADRVLPQANGLKLLLTFRPESFQVVRHSLSLNVHCYYADPSPEADILAADPPALHLLPFSAEELSQAYERYRRAYHLRTPFSALPPDLKETLRHPLLLRLTAEVCASAALPETLSSGRILQEFLNHLYRHGRVRQSDLLFLEERVVSRMLTPGRWRNAVPMGEVMASLGAEEFSPLIRLADAGLLASTNGRLDEPVRFAHERFYEHFAWRYLIRERELASDPVAFYEGLRGAPWYLHDPLRRLVAAEVARRPDRRLWAALAFLPEMVLAGALEDEARRRPAEGTALLRSLWRWAQPFPMGRPEAWQENLGRAVLLAAGAVGDGDLLEKALRTAAPSLRNTVLLQAKDLWREYPQAAQAILAALADRAVGPLGLPRYSTLTLLGPLFLLSLFDYGDRPEVLASLRDLLVDLVGRAFGGVRGRLLLYLIARWLTGWVRRAAVEANLTVDLDRDFHLTPAQRATLRVLAPYVDWETPGFSTEAVHQNLRAAVEMGSLLAGWIVVLAVVQQGLGNPKEGWPALRRLVAEAAVPPVPPWADTVFHSAYELLRVAPSRDPALWGALEQGMAWILEDYPNWHRTVQAYRLGRPPHPPGPAQGVAPYALARSAARLPVTVGPFWDAVRHRLESQDPAFALDYLQELRYVALDGRRPALALRMLETRPGDSPLVNHPDPLVRARLVDLLASVRAIASEDVRDFLERCASPELAAQVARHPTESPSYAWLYYRLEEWVYPFLARSRASRRLVADLFALAAGAGSVQEWIEESIGRILRALSA
ncbi:MAG: hypothetical protein H5T61_14035 [Thermoflexales bacterium]|nr:hypothetical protein [Thermoflexales bacterium]